MPDLMQHFSVAKPLRGIIFDCDGVLIDSRDANIGYYNRLLAEVGRPPMSREQEDYTHMASGRQAIEHILRPGELARLDELTARVPYRETVLPLLRLEDGARSVLERLRGRARLAVHTNRSNGMWDVLNVLSLYDVFDPVMTVDVVAPKPSPEGVLRILEAWNVPAGSVVFVGDSLVDAQAAAGAGVPLIAFRNAALDAAAHVASFVELEELVRPVLPVAC